MAAKNGGSPIIVGQGEKQAFLASDIPAILPYTREMISLYDGDFALLSEEGVQVVDAEGRPVDRDFMTIQWDPVSAERGGYDHFMQKEIFEQPRAITDTIGTRGDRGRARRRSRRHRVLEARRPTRSARSAWSPAARPRTPAWWAST